MIMTEPLNRYCVFLNGDYGSDSSEFYLNVTLGATVIAADAAVLALKRFGITADIVVGDFDSAPWAVAEYAQAG